MEPIIEYLLYRYYMNSSDDMNSEWDFEEYLQTVKQSNGFKHYLKLPSYRSSVANKKE